MLLNCGESSVAIRLELSGCVVEGRPMLRDRCKNHFAVRLEQADASAAATAKLES